MKKSINLARKVCLCVMVSALVMGCSTAPEQRREEKAPKVQLSASAQLIQEARKLTSPAKEQKLLKAVPLLLQEGNVIGAENLLVSLQLQSLPPALKAEAGIASADIALSKGQFQNALDILNADRYGILSHANELPIASQNRISLMRADAMEHLGDPLAAANERIFVSPMLNDAALAENNERIWNDLAQLPTETLQQLAETTTTPDLQAWLTLIAIYKTHQDDLNSQIEAVEHWSRQHVSHPARRAVPRAIAMLQALADSRPHKIALLIPQSGPFRPAAEAIEHGFMAAYYHTLETREDKSSAASIKIYEEGTQDTLISTYQQAVKDGAELVIGPLSKENVRKLYQFKEKLPVPTLALNSSDMITTPPANLFQFGLSPEDDARETARHAATYGYTNAAILYQDNGEWSQRVQRAFTQQWETLGKRVIARASYKTGIEMEGAVKSLLLMEDSARRAQQLSKTIGENLSTEPRSRADLDFVFLITPGEQARQVKPLFDFHYASQVPLMGGSYLYSGINSPATNKDLNGIEFCDIPWILNAPSPLHQAFNKAWPQAEPRMARFNALGVDAYRLADRLQAMAQIPESKLYGATGIIKLDSQGRINRSLAWAKFNGGVATSLIETHPATPDTTTEPPAPESTESDSFENE